jgi:hypothetical protein
MNNFKFRKFIEALLYLFTLLMLIVLLLWGGYILALFIGIKMPNPPAISILFQINFFTVIKFAFYIALIDTFLFLIIGVGFAAKSTYNNKRNENYSTKELNLYETIGRFILGSYIPCVALFSLTENQFSSLVNISAIFTIFFFFFNIGRRE